jgi:hypothetical protein
MWWGSGGDGGDREVMVMIRRCGDDQEVMAMIGRCGDDLEVW